MTPQIYDVRVREIIERTYNVKSVRFDLPEHASFAAGQFMLASFVDKPDLKRYVSISNSPTEKGYLEFTKKLTDSEFSCALRKLNVNDVMKIQFPFGSFTLKKAGAKIAFLSGGIGITPIRSMIKFAVDTKAEYDISLLYANRSVRDVVFHDDFEKMQHDFSNLKVFHILCEPAPGFQCSIGLINAAMIKQLVADYAQRTFFLCGPPGMVEAMKTMLREELQVMDQNIVTENFQGY